MSRNTSRHNTFKAAKRHYFVQRKKMCVEPEQKSDLLHTHIQNLSKQTLIKLGVQKIYPVLCTCQSASPWSFVLRETPGLRGFPDSELSAPKPEHLGTGLLSSLKPLQNSLLEQKQTQKISKSNLGLPKGKLWGGLQLRGWH